MRISDKIIFTVILVAVFSSDLSFRSVSAMDGPPPIKTGGGDQVLQDQAQQNYNFQVGVTREDGMKAWGVIRDFAQHYGYTVHCKSGKLVGHQIFAAFLSGGHKIYNPELLRQRITGKVGMNPLPPGDYIRSDICPPWMESSNIAGAAPNRFQGFKLHISAKPETALIIANIVLPILQESNVRHKVMYDLGYMRFAYYLSQYFSQRVMMPDGSSSQAGKFIAIYPNNPETARKVIEKIDTAFKVNHIGPEWFVKLAGDAQVGDTGGIFVRYGKFADIAHNNVPEKMLRL